MVAPDKFRQISSLGELSVITSNFDWLLVLSMFSLIARGIQFLGFGFTTLNLKTL